MDGSFKCLLLCGQFLILVAAPIQSSKEDIAEIIQLPKNLLFKLLRIEDEEDSYVPEISTRRKVMKFSIKQMTCLISDTDDVENCAFIPGEAMECAATVITDQQAKRITGQCMKESYTQKGELLQQPVKKDVMDETQETFEFSVDLKKTHKLECLDCIFTHLPTHQG